MTVPESPAPAPYEFSPEQDKVIGDLGGQMRFVGVFTVVYGAVSLVSMIAAIWTSNRLNIDFNPILALFVGSWMISAGRSFQEVALTRGHDMSHLMTALDKLRNVFGLLAFLLYLALAIAVVVMVLALALNAKDYWLSVAGHPIR